MDLFGGPSIPLQGFTVSRPVQPRLEELTAPTDTVVTLSTLKSHLRITHSEDDAYLTQLILTATDIVEKYLSRRLLPRNVRMWIDFIPGTGNEYSMFSAGTIQAPVRYASVGMFRQLELMGTPVSAVTAFKYITNAGVTQVFDPGNYIVDLSSPGMPARIILQRGSVWPVDLQVAKAIFIEYSLGYASVNAVPSSLKHGLLLAAAALWSNRGDNTEADGTEVLKLANIASILNPYRVRRISTL